MIIFLKVIIFGLHTKTLIKMKSHFNGCHVFFVQFYENKTGFIFAKTHRNMQICF